MKSEVQSLYPQIPKSRWMAAYDILIIRFVSLFLHQFLERTLAFITVTGLFAKCFLHFPSGDTEN